MSQTIEQAAEAASEQLNKETSQEEEVIETEEEKEEESSTEDDEEVEAQSQKVKEALQLQEILNDPEKAKNFVAILNQKFANENKGATAQEKADAAKAFAEELKKEVGEHNEFMLEPALKIFDKLFAKQNAETKAELAQIRQEMIQKQVMTDYDSFITENKIDSKLEKEMEKVSKEFPPNVQVPVKKYLDKVLIIAKANLGVVSQTSSNKDKILKNKTTQQRMNGVESEEGTVKKSPEKFSLREAAEAAMRGETWE